MACDRKDMQQRGMWSYVSDEERVPQHHPLRAISAMTDAALKDLTAKLHPRFAITPASVRENLRSLSRIQSL
jgi:hypothetical protein